MFAPQHFFDLSQTDHAGLFRDGEPVWAALSAIGPYLTEKFQNSSDDSRILGEVHPTAEIGPQVHIAEGAVVEAHAVIKGPAWIGRGTVVRSGAYIREMVLVGDHSVVGNSCELKNCLLFNRCEIPHYNYVGDSIVGYRGHLGAGALCSNTRLDRQNITVRTAQGERVDTGLRKFGAIIGDGTEVGCNAVLNPGTLLGKRCVIYPNTHWTGVLPDHQIVKLRQTLEIVERT